MASAWPTHALFQEEWWLDTVAPGAWRALTVESGGRLRARWPIVEKRRAGLRVLSQPPLTPFLGPWLDPGEGKASRRLAVEKDLAQALIAQLPRFDLMLVNCHYELTNWLPFHWSGFTQTTAYSYVLEDLSDEGELWSGLQENVRREIRKARARVEVESTVDAGALCEVATRTFGRQNRPMPYSPALVSRIVAACADRGCGEVLLARDADGHVHAGALIVWDDRSAYYLMGGGDPQFRTSGAHSLVLWEAILRCRTRTRAFDFEGSMVEPIERFFRGFGGGQRQYFRLTAMSRRMRVLWYGRECVKAILR